jgi:hypothetical protein
MQSNSLRGQGTGGRVLQKGVAMRVEESERPWWRRWLDEPFWPTLLAVFMLSVLGAIPFWLIAALIWGNATGLAADLMFIVGYLLAVPFTWWLLHERRR